LTSALALAMGFAGLAFGLVYFAVVRRSVALFVAGRGWLAPVALTLGRLGAALLFFALTAKIGASALLAAFLGVLLARTLALRAGRRAA